MHSVPAKSKSMNQGCLEGEHGESQSTGFPCRRLLAEDRWASAPNILEKRVPPRTIIAIGPCVVLIQTAVQHWLSPILVYSKLGRAGKDA